MENSYVRLREGGKELAVHNMDIERTVHTFGHSGGDRDEKIATFISVTRKEDAASHVDVEIKCSGETTPFHVGDVVDVVWQSKKREAGGLFGSGEQKKESVRGRISNAYNDIIVVRIMGDDGQRVIDNERHIHRACFVFTRIKFLRDSLFYAFPRYVVGEKLPRWVIVSSKECNEKYTGLVQRDDDDNSYVAVHALADDECAIPTVRFQPDICDGLDEMVFGDMAIVVKADAINDMTKRAAAQLRSSLENIEPLHTYEMINDDGDVGGDSSNDSTFPMLTQRVEKTFERFSPRNFVVDDSGAIMVWPSSEQKSNTLLNIIWEKGACVTVVNLGKYCIRDITTSKALISNGYVWVGAVTDQNQYRMVRISKDSEPHILEETFDEPIQHLCTKEGAVRPVTSNPHVVFETFSNGAFMLGRKAEEDPGNVHLFSSVDGVTFTEHKFNNRTGHFVYAVSDFGRLGIVCLRKRRNEDGELADTKISFISKTVNQVQHKALDHMPLSVCVASDHAVWITGKNPGSLIRYDPDDASYLPQGAQTDIDLSIGESVVELVRHGQDGAVLAFSLKNVFLIRRDGTYESQEHLCSSAVGGLCLKAPKADMDLDFESILDSTPTEEEDVDPGRVKPIDFYAGDRKEICPYNSTIERREDGAITSVNMNGDYDVLVNARLRDRVMVQHLAEVRTVDRASIEISSSDKPFVLSGYRNMNSMCLANDPYGSVRAPEIYDFLNPTNFRFHGVFFHQDVFMKNTIDGYAGTGVLCSTDYASRLSDTFIYYAYGSGFWER
jgi:hypothetical protein